MGKQLVQHLVDCLPMWKREYNDPTLVRLERCHECIDAGVDINRQRFVVLFQFGFQVVAHRVFGIEAGYIGPMLGKQECHPA